ncbi:peptidylprolyl isomerase [Paracoccus sp. p4-l81]|uniref:peptidylprolyl isomerase n=1 Tax=unclassified Paracoccus (in: a-proteobacteria) TaxID=2688777 RepID=UPI0035B986E0
MFNKSLMAAAVAAMIAGPALAQPADGPGPNVVIEVAGADGAAKGKVVIDLASDSAPNHAARIVELAKGGAYDGVVFHRVIDGFMAQTGDVQYGKKDGNTAMAGMGGSDLPDLKAEFSNRSFARGIVGMARSADPDSANSQFFIMFAPAPHLDGQYTVVGHVLEGMEVIDAVKKGDAAANGSVEAPDYMAKVTVAD